MAQAMQNCPLITKIPHWAFCCCFSLFKHCCGYHRLALEEDFVYKNSSNSACTGDCQSLSLGSGKICVLPFACLPTAQGKAIKEGAGEFLGKAEPSASQRLSVALLNSAHAPARPSQYWLLGRACQSWKFKSAHFSLAQGNRGQCDTGMLVILTERQRDKQKVLGECCCSPLYGICHCCW